MKIELFTLRIGGGKSFYARIDGQTMAVADAFCVLDSGPLPVCVGMCCVDVRIQFDRSEEGVKQIRISFMDEEGRLAMPSLETTLDVKMTDNAPTATVPFAFFIQQLSVPAFGVYSIELAVDGRIEASTPLYIRQKA